MRIKHWYYVTSIYCPVCGHTKNYRERRYGRKPKDLRARWHEEQHYDHCLERESGL